jgi:hypothetical protein
MLIYCLHYVFRLQSISEERKKSWDMVVDTASLLNKESRKALQLLQGLKGTRLIIPQSGTNEYHMPCYFVLNWFSMMTLLSNNFFSHKRIGKH